MAYAYTMEGPDCSSDFIGYFTRHHHKFSLYRHKAGFCCHYIYTLLRYSSGQFRKLSEVVKFEYIYGDPRP